MRGRSFERAACAVYRLNCGVCSTNCFEALPDFGRALSSRLDLEHLCRLELHVDVCAKRLVIEFRKHRKVRNRNWGDPDILTNGIDTLFR